MFSGKWCSTTLPSMYRKINGLTLGALQNPHCNNGVTQKRDTKLNGEKQ
jgi:hypothetical protein